MSCRLLHGFLLPYLGVPVRRVSKFRVINLDGRYRTTNRPPAAGLRPLRID